MRKLLDKHCRLHRIAITCGVVGSTVLALVEPSLAAHAGAIGLAANLLWIWER
jgi:hypothetical protein